MNRIIKFRAWDIKESCWFEGWSLHCNGHYCDNTVEEDARGLPHWKDVPENLIIMQATGIKDINGRDVFEGDICKTKAWDKPVAIFWDEKNCMFEMKDAYDFVESVHEDDAFEVIGNIHATLELWN